MVGLLIAPAYATNCFSARYSAHLSRFASG